MNTLLKASAVIVFAMVPLLSFAKSDEPVTRAQVRADLVRAEQAGYNPRDWKHYPENIQMAQARIATEDRDQSYGAAAAGSSQAGQRGNARVSP